MTIEEWLVNQLYENGFSRDAAKSIMPAIKSDPLNDVLSDRWEHQIEDYPNNLKSLFWRCAKKHALDWIKANNPQAIYRPIYEDTPPDILLDWLAAEGN